VFPPSPPIVVVWHDFRMAGSIGSSRRSMRAPPLSFCQPAAQDGRHDIESSSKALRPLDTTGSKKRLGRSTQGMERAMKATTFVTLSRSWHCWLPCRAPLWRVFVSQIGWDTENTPRDSLGRGMSTARGGDPIDGYPDDGRLSQESVSLRSACAGKSTSVDRGARISAVACSWMKDKDRADAFICAQDSDATQGGRPFTGQDVKWDRDAVYSRQSQKKKGEEKRAGQPTQLMYLKSRGGERRQRHPVTLHLKRLAQALLHRRCWHPGHHRLPWSMCRRRRCG